MITQLKPWTEDDARREGMQHCMCTHGPPEGREEYARHCADASAE